MKILAKDREGDKRPKKSRNSKPSDSHPDGLAAVSPKHDIWNTAKTNAVTIEQAYGQTEDLTRYAERVGECSELLMLKETVNQHGEVAHKANAHQCEVRHCPICQRARAHKLRKRFAKAIEIITTQYPKYRWLFVTITIKNPPIVELRAALKEMNKAWNRLLLLKDFPNVKGWIRATEVTMGEQGAEFCHPHFHCLLLVTSNYFKTGYVKHSEWVDLWKRAARLDYDPDVKVTAIKDLGGGIDREIIKVAGYSVKSEEVAENPKWFTELHRQTHHLRFHATGGLVKQFIPKEDEKLTGEEVAEDDTEEAETGRGVLFGYRRDVKKYRRKSMPEPFR
jgi:plasmid rolling circle replication initiator protein Rep